MLLNIRFLAFFGALCFLSSCGGTFTGRPPSLTSNLSLSSEDGRAQEFLRLIRKISGLNPEEVSESGAALILTSQINTFKAVKDQKSSAAASLRSQSSPASVGKCLLLYSGDSRLEDQGFDQDEIGFSESQNLAFTKQNAFSPEQCQQYFSKKAPKLFADDFSNIHITFYRTIFP